MQKIGQNNGRRVGMVGSSQVCYFNIIVGHFAINQCMRLVQVETVVKKNLHIEIVPEVKETEFVLLAQNSKNRNL